MKKLISILAIFSMLFCCSVMSCSFAAEEVTAYGINAALKREIEQPEAWYTGILNWVNNNKVKILISAVGTFCAWYFGRQGVPGVLGNDAQVIRENVLAALGENAQARLAALGFNAGPAGVPVAAIAALAPPAAVAVGRSRPILQPTITAPAA